ncbi:MAG: hypothetical protein AB7L17_23280 [Ilumatobacteraceae bacterium]|jgi:hypothetical protein
MSRNQNTRWRKKHLAVAAVAFSLGGYTAISAATVSASNDGEWGCLQPSAIELDGQYCPPDTDGSYDSIPVDSVPDSIPVDSVPDSVPVTDPAPTDPVETTPQQLPPQPTPAPTAAPTVAPQVAPETVVAAPSSLPVTGQGSALPTAFIAVGLLGAGSVALAFARRGNAARSSQS